MQHFEDSDLRDPSPPVPGDKERAAVAARANQLGRKRRFMQGAGALGMVAAVAVGVAALTAGGTSGSGGAGRIEAADPAGTTATTEAVVTTTVPAPVTTVPAPNTAPAAAAEAPLVEAPAPVPPAGSTPAPVVPSTFTVSGTVSNIPPGATLTLTLSGPGGSFSAVADGAGNYSISGVPAGTYDGMYEWSSTDGTATQVGRAGGITVSGDSTFSFTLP